MNRFWDILFDANEETCFATNIYGTRVLPVEAGKDAQRNFFSINPLSTARLDSNVTCYRNILLEFDKGSPQEQLAIIDEIPYSTLVWSGGKSHHAIISLEEPCASRAEYDALIRHIYAKVPAADKSVKNPSRLSRVPGVERDNGNMQELVNTRQRVSKTELEAWLGPLPAKITSDQPRMKSLGISEWTRYFLKYGSNPGQRNSDLFKAACDMLRHGYSVEEIQERAGEVLDLPYYEIKSCVASAASAVRRN